MPRSWRGSPRAVVAVSALAVGFGSSPGFVFGFLAPPLQADLGLDRWQLGLLVGAFFGATGLGSVLGGRIADRIGPRRAVVADQVAVAGALTVGALVPHYAVLLAAAVVAGAGYALTNAGTSIAIAAVLPPHRHGVALAVRTAGVPSLVAVSAVTAAGLAAVVGWRPVLAGYAPLLLAIALLAARVLPGHGPAAVRDGSAALPRGFLRFPLAAFALIAGSQALFSWMVPFLHEEGGLSLAAAGALTSAGALAAVVGMVVVARRSDRGAAAGRLPAVVLLSLLTATGELLLVAGLVAGPASMAAGLLLATVAQLAAISLMHAAVIAAAPAAVGRAAGVTMAGYYLGALLGPPLFGLTVDAGGYGPAWLLSAGLVVAGAVGFWACRRVGATPAVAAASRSR